MRVRAQSVAVTVAAVALLALPSATAAKPKQHTLTLPGSFSLTARLPKSHGYALRLQSHGHRRISLSVAGGGSFATYSAKGRANRNRVDADFGRFGHVALRFKGRTRLVEDKLFGDCRRRPTVEQLGTLSGRLRFRGEAGFVEVSTDRVKAQTSREYREVCPLRHAGVNTLGVGRAGTSRKSDEELDLLAATAHSHGRHVSFAAVRFPILGSIYLAQTREHVGRVSATKTALFFGNERSLALSKTGVHPETARVTLREPFAGAAEYLENPGHAPSWTGSLRVLLPGAGVVPLTGQGFHATLCRGVSFRQLERNCRAQRGPPSKPVQSALRLLPQGSGSHSQALADARLSWSR
jgi:hypothetical protein